MSTARHVLRSGWAADRNPCIAPSIQQSNPDSLMNPSATIRSTLLASAMFAVTGAIALAEDAPAAPPPAPAATTAPAAAAPVPSEQGALPSNRVVATIDGVPITEFDLAAAEPDLQQALSQFPQDAQMAALVKG